MAADTATPFRVIIVGAGLSGSLLANGLMANGIDVSVFERLPQHSKQEGYQIRLGAPALNGMRACLTPAQVSAVVQRFGRGGGSKKGAPAVYDKHFRELLDLTRFPVYSKSAPINRVVLRDALAGPVFEAGKLQYQKAFVRYEILKQAGGDRERVRVWFDDGSSDDCDILIGADGSHSKINKQLGLNNLTQIKSHLSMVAKSELPTWEYERMTPALRTKPVITFIDNKTMYFCAYLPDKLDETEDQGGDGVKFDDTLSSSMFALHVPTESCPPDLREKSLEEQWDFVSYAMRDWAKEFHEVIDLVRGKGLYLYHAMVSAPPPKNWRSKVQDKDIAERGHPRVWLMGDAMHAMLPTRGMGGNQSMQDTAVVLPLLVRLSTATRTSNLSHELVVDACKEYEDEMIPRAFEWVKKSGGASVCPVDSSRIGGKLFFLLAAQVVNIAHWCYRLASFFRTKGVVDDAPEFQD